VRRRPIAAVLALAAAALALASCTPREKPPQTRELVFWQSCPAGVADSLVAAFERDHPGLEVRVEAIAPACMAESLRAAFASGRAPDLCQVGAAGMPALLAGGRLADWSAGVADLRDSLLGWELCSVGEAIYGVPWALETRALYYNEALLARARLDPHDPPETWDQLARAAAAIQRLGRGIHGYGVPSADTTELVRQALPYLLAGGGILSEDTRHAVFDSSANVRAFELLLRLRRSGTTGSEESLERGFVKGRLGLLLAGAGLVRRIAAEAPALRYGVALVPRPLADEGANVSWVGGELLVSLNASAHKRLALDLARFLVRPENVRRLTAAVPGLLPAVAGADTSAWYRARPREQVLLRQLAAARFAPNHPAWGAMEAAIGDELELALDGTKSAEQAVKDAQERLVALAGKR
jgi:multiple sugar transport system substrate-binding protein